mmetsp:Transcript_46557/g.47022  ORF Transcript_46557/g.47022 Transcript_46557/m.47022 type:complete len:252 (-) Transcript_46557:300-1055(-)
MEMIFGVTSGTELMIRHGLGKQHLQKIASMECSVDTIVPRWQKMMEVYLGSQLHILAGLGYPADDSGINIYNQQVQQLLGTIDPSKQEELRVAGRDLWRLVLSTTFSSVVSDDDLESQVEVSIVDARNIMHKVSQRMMSTEVLERVAKICGGVVVLDPNAPTGSEHLQKHTLVQEIMIKDVYLGGEPSLVNECGFGDGEKGYIRMQLAIAEHQNDPLVAQYVGGAMMKILEVAGLDQQSLQQAAANSAAVK